MLGTPYAPVQEETQVGSSKRDGFGPALPPCFYLDYAAQAHQYLLLLDEGVSPTDRAHRNSADDKHANRQERHLAEVE